ncbi:Uncharacterised protein [Escherichia coli]|nr:Uncharacterised protein [Escherichia coli]
MKVITGNTFNIPVNRRASSNIQTSTFISFIISINTVMLSCIENKATYAKIHILRKVDNSSTAKKQIFILLILCDFKIRLIPVD